MNFYGFLTQTSVDPARFFIPPHAFDQAEAVPCREAGRPHGYLGMCRRLGSVRRSCRRIADRIGRRSNAQKDRRRAELTRVTVMFDFLMLAYGVGFFFVAVVYALACEKM
jgi:hypothetical protein